MIKYYYCDKIEIKKLKQNIFLGAEDNKSDLTCAKFVLETVEKDGINRINGNRGKRIFYVILCGYGKPDLLQGVKFLLV